MLRQRYDMELTTGLKESTEERFAAIQERLGTEEFVRCRQQGSSMTMEAARDFALKRI